MQRQLIEKESRGEAAGGMHSPAVLVADHRRAQVCRGGPDRRGVGADLIDRHVCLPSAVEVFVACRGEAGHVEHAPPGRLSHRVGRLAVEAACDLAGRRRRVGLVAPCRPYSLRPGQRLVVEVVQPDGRRALVAGVLDSVPETAHGQALRIVVCDAQVRALPAK